MTDKERAEVCQKEIRRLRSVVRELENELEQRDNCIAELKKVLSDAFAKIDALYTEG